MSTRRFYKRKKSLSEMVFFCYFSNSVSLFTEKLLLWSTKRSNSGHLLDASKCALNCDFLSHSSHGCSVFSFFRCSIFRQPVNVSFLFYLSIIETQCWTHFSLPFSFWAFSFSVVFTNWLQKKKLGHKLLASSSIIYISRLTFYALLATIMRTSSGVLGDVVQCEEN